jgi:bifunctional enzyme CysN/CysC
MAPATADPRDVGDVEAYLAQHQRKQLLRFVVVGSVDDGKSTLIGRLLYDSQGIYEDQLRAVAHASKRVGTVGAGRLDLALLTDGLRAEREQGITIDVAYRYFTTPTRKFIIADTPGHVQYTRNMVTGASTATAAVILIDARRGVLQQSRRHAFIASLIGIPYLAVCINKMDLCGWAEDRFEAIRADFTVFAEKLRFEEVRFFPVSALEGDNIVSRGARAPWYAGPTLLEHLEHIPVAGEPARQPLRFPVQYVLRPNLDYRGFAGQIASGVARVGDEVVVLPSGRRTRIASIDTYEGPLERAFAPMSVALRLGDEVDVSRGDAIVAPGAEPAAARRFEAMLVWMNDRPLDLGRSYFLKHTTRVVRASVEKLCGRVDLETLAETAAATLELNDIGRVVVTSNQPVFVDPYAQSRPTGGFILVDSLSNETLAAGVVLAALDERAGERRAAGVPSLVPELERAARLGQRGVAVVFGGDPAEGQAAVAYALERRLFEAGRLATVIDVSRLADGTRSPALFADLAEQCVSAGLVTILAEALPRAAERAELAERLGDRRLVLATGPAAADEVSVALGDVGAAVERIVAALAARGFIPQP